MNLLINRKPVEGPWGGGNLFVKAFHRYMTSCDHSVHEALSGDLDFIVVQDPRPAAGQINFDDIIAFKQQHPKVKIVHRVNECDARKATTGVDDFLRRCSNYTDHTIFVSNWMQAYHVERGWNCKSHSVLYNGVNLEHFKSVPKIANGKTNIVTHHWSDNPLKGADVYEFLDNFVGKNPNFTFTYIGRTKQQFKNATVIPPLSGADLGACLARYDVYISGTRFDPGPNHIIESLACELPTFTFSEGGGACEFVGKKHIFHDATSLVSALQNYKSVGANVGLQPHSWETCMKNLANTLQRVRS